MASPINPARVDFVTLRLFCAVAQSGSITKGAEACHLALSAASRRLSDFEAATGSKLLERSSQGIALTPAGHVAMQHAMRLFQGFEQFSNELGDYSSGVRGHVRLWANMSALTEFLPATLAEFQGQPPRLLVALDIPRPLRPVTVFRADRQRSADPAAAPGRAAERAQPRPRRAPHGRSSTCSGRYVARRTTPG